MNGIKIDRSFICDVMDDPADATISRGLITIARGLELATMAEGIETTEQMELLCSPGCHSMQGYLFAKPMPADELAERVAAGEDRRREDTDGRNLLSESSTACTRGARSGRRVDADLAAPAPSPSG